LIRLIEFTERKVSIGEYAPPPVVSKQADGELDHMVLDRPMIKGGKRRPPSKQQPMHTETKAAD
jgi:hypothetical protein